MRTQEQKLLTAWPAWLLCLMMLPLFAKICLGIVGSTTPAGFLGAVPFLVLTASGIALFQSRHLRGHTLLMTVGLVGCFFASSWVVSQSPSGMGISAIALGIGLCLIPVTASLVRDPKALETKNELTARLIDDVSKELQPIEVLNEPDEEMLQSWQRVRLFDGSERIEGTLTVHFQPGERIRHCHLPISPAFLSLPEGWCESSDPDIQVEFSLLQTYGVRISARRGLQCSAACTTELTIVILSAQTTRSAA